MGKGHRLIWKHMEDSVHRQRPETSSWEQGSGSLSQTRRGLGGAERSGQAQGRKEGPGPPWSLGQSQHVGRAEPQDGELGAKILCPSPDLGVPARSVPAGSVPAGSVPARSVPAGSVPTRSVPAGSVPCWACPHWDVSPPGVSLPGASLPGVSLPGVSPLGHVPPPGEPPLLAVVRSNSRGQWPRARPAPQGLKPHPVHTLL